MDGKAKSKTLKTIDGIVLGSFKVDYQSLNHLPVSKQTHKCARAARTAAIVQGRTEDLEMQIERGYTAQNRSPVETPTSVVSKQVRAKMPPLPAFLKHILSSAVQGQAASRSLDREPVTTSSKV